MTAFETRTHLPELSDRLDLGDEKIPVSPFCLGMVGDPEVIPAAFDAGINFFFVTADMHWPYYEKTRKGLEMLLSRGGGVRDEIVVGTVSYATQLEFCSTPHHEVVQSVEGLERIDVAIAGGAYAHEFMSRVQVYERHREERFLGTRAIGTTFHDRDAARLAHQGEMVDIAYIRFNPLHPGARLDLFPLLKRKTSTLLYNFKNTMGYLSEEKFRQLGIGEGPWRPEHTDFYRFVLSDPHFDGVLCGLGEPGQVEALARAMAQGPLDSKEFQYMLDLGDLITGRASLSSP
ncbi:MAG: hypothetical protein QF752_12535 [Planctomycetota bacterium]|jgi:hypothetical protein|nr:hypothetical protein [Planctomycetota bacterium]